MPPAPPDAVRVPWPELRRLFSEAVERGLAPWLGARDRYVEEQLAFALGRLDAGISLLGHFDAARRPPGDAPRDLLDVGTGNGGLALAFANSPDYRVSCLDVGPNGVLRSVARSSGLPVRYALASGLDLPYPSDRFDIVLLVETIEHIRRPRRLGSEVMRVLRPGGVCFVSTPARLRYVFGPDPHYGVRGI